MVYFIWAFTEHGTIEVTMYVCTFRNAQFCFFLHGDPSTFRSNVGERVVLGQQVLQGCFQGTDLWYIISIYHKYVQYIMRGKKTRNTQKITLSSEKNVYSSSFQHGFSASRFRLFFKCHR